MKLQDLNCIYNKFHKLSDQDWLEVLIRSIMKPTIDGVHMPSFPSEEVQRVTHSVTNEAALQDAYMFFQEVKKYAQYCDRAIEHTRTLLDFGCGWGRATRLFMKDLPADKIFGIEPAEPRFLIARNCNPYLTFIKSTHHPPTVFATNCFDYIIALSVFTHLNEFLALKWVNEFSRILKPGGLMLVTTQPKQFLEFCREKRQLKDKGTQLEHPWHIKLANSFVDTEKEMQRYQQGKFLFSPESDLHPRWGSWWGQAVIPPNYIRTHWTEKMVFVDFVDDPKRLSQALIVMQKP